MDDNMGTAPKEPRESSNSSEQMDNPPLWSPWNFLTKRRDWHEVIYDEMRPGYVKAENP